MDIKKGRWLVLSVIFILALILSIYSLNYNKQLRITDITTAKGINEKLMPTEITNRFNAGAQKVFCWFAWRNATANTPILASWHYVTDDIHILDYNFNLPKKEGFGSISLSMPEGKQLPAGLYRVELKKGTKTLKSFNFNVLEKA